MFDVLIKNGKIFDGTGAEAKITDIAIKNGKIFSLGDFKNERAKTEINAENKFVSPGFIDLNNNADHYLNIFDLPEAENLIRQGITTIVCGNCGASLAPLISGSLEVIQQWAKVTKININWRRLKDFLKTLEEKKLGVNFATLIGWGTLRNDFTKGEFRNLQKEEFEKLKFIISQSMEEGAFGVSFGLGYPFEQATGLKETQEIAKIVKRKNGFLAFHLRNEAEGFLASAREAIEVAAREDVSIEISHFRVEGEPNFNSFPEGIKMVEKANKEKELVNFDIFPYDSNAHSLYSILPDWAAIGGREVLLKNINDRAVRNKLIEELKRKKYLYKELVIADCGEKWWFSGKTLEEIAKNFNLALEETILEIVKLCEERIIVFNKTLSAENIEKGITSPYSFIVTNSSFYNIESGEKGIFVHPRAFGSFPRYLGHYIREKKIFPWEKAINKITGKVAEKLALKDRGLIKENYWADVVIFNAEKINDKSSLKNPFQYPEGIETVLINGNLAYHRGVLTRQRWGKVLPNI